MDLKINKFFPSLNNISIDQKKTVFELFSSNFNIISHEEIIKVMAKHNKATSKNANISEKQRYIGNDFFKLHNYKEAFNYYYLSLQQAPFESYDYMMALAERSKAHFALKNYKEALIDIERVLSYSTFPKEMLCKIYIRQSQCFLRFKQYFNTLDACDKAYNNMKKFKNVIDPEQFVIRTNFIKQVVDEIDEFSNEEDQPYVEPQCSKPLLKDGENPKFLNASNAVEIEYNDRKGRHVIAKTNLKPGDILFVEEPYCAVRNDNYLFCMRYCSNCFTYCETSLPCKYCLIHFYCTEHCREIAWIREHRWICYGERNNLLGDAMRLTLIVIFKAAASNFDTNIIDKSVYGNRYNNFPFVCNLATNRKKMSNKEISEFTKLSIWMVIYLMECTDFFIWLHARPAFADKKLTDLYNFIGGHILQLCMQIHCNSDEIIDAAIDLPEQILKRNNIGFGLYVSSAMINHSCVPNTRSTFEQTLKVVRATKKIPKNTEITIHYLCIYKDRRYLEKDFLRNNYKFNCTCPKCASPLKIEKKPWLCNKCHGKAYNITETQAKCVNCRIIFNLKGYKHIEDSLEAMFQCLSLSSIENIYKKMKKIYHKDNINFSFHLEMTYEYYSEEANIQKFIEISKDLVQLSDKYSDIDEMKLHAYLKLLRSTGMKNFFMNLQLLPSDKAAYDEFQEIKEKGLDMLKYFVSAKHIKVYKQYIHDFLDPNQPC